MLPQRVPRQADVSVSQGFSQRLLRVGRPSAERPAFDAQVEGELGFGGVQSPHNPPTGFV